MSRLRTVDDKSIIDKQKYLFCYRIDVYLGTDYAHIGPGLLNEYTIRYDSGG